MGEEEEEEPWAEDEEVAWMEEGDEVGMVSAFAVELLDFLIVILILFPPAEEDALGVEDWRTGYKLDFTPSSEQQLEPEGVCRRLGSSPLSPRSLGRCRAE